MIVLLIENLSNLNSLSITFVIVMTMIFLWSLFKKAASKTLNSIHKAVAPKATETLTSLGVLGTFTGIFVGILGFNPNNLNESIPILLKG